MSIEIIQPVSGGRLRKLGLGAGLLVAFCLALGAFSHLEQEALRHLWRLERENRAKDAAIEELQRENRLLKEKLTFRHKVEELVAQVQQEAAGLDQRIIRPAAETALSHTTDPALYLAIGLVEAELRAKVVHADGVALGMHGLCPKDWHAFLKAKGIMHSRNDYFDPVKSFRGSEAVLSALVREYGSLEKALLFYNGGSPAVAGRIPSSRGYVQRVLRLREIFTARLREPEKGST